MELATLSRVFPWSRRRPNADRFDIGPLQFPINDLFGVDDGLSDGEKFYSFCFHALGASREHRRATPGEWVEQQSLAVGVFAEKNFNKTGGESFLVFAPPVNRPALVCLKTHERAREGSIDLELVFPSLLCFRIQRVQFLQRC